MTPLATRLIRRVRSAGPMTLAEYMAACLTDPEHGYYTGRDPLGAAGDFTTAPEISQMFGELLGLALAQAWLDRGAPAPFVLAELGPGRGTLMADALRATARVPGFHKAARLHLVEVSPALRARQAETLTGHAPTWAGSVSELPEGPLFLIANEFFDALPIRQFRRTGEGWAEAVVGLDAEGRLAPGWSPPAPIAALAHRQNDTAEGDIVETCAPAAAIAAEIAGRIAGRGGVALIVDYGGCHSLGDTFQALEGHAPADPFDRPGEADLTAHVDFEPLARAARDAGAGVAGPVPQGVFLERLGITPRAEKLAASLSGPPLTAHIAAHRRLTHPAEMGHLFKVMAFHDPQFPPPPGFGP